MSPQIPSLRTKYLFILIFPTILIGYWLYTASTSKLDQDPFANLSDDEILAAAKKFYDSRPYYERPRDFSKIPAGLPDLRAQTCGQCHRQIYEEWAISTHARAWTDDIQFMEELEKNRGAATKDSPDVSWMCVNCHIPMTNQLDRLVLDLKDGDIGQPIYVDNPYFDPAMQEDAISCATCHVQEGIIYGPRGDQDSAPHPVARGEFLQDETVCVQCHQAQALFPDQSLGCFFTTGQEWAQSPAAQEGQTCQSCHMPQTHRKIAEDFDVPERLTRHHWFGGSLIPKKLEYEEEIAPLRPIFGSGASIALIEDPEEGLAVEIKNEFAGHLFPTGDPERHVDVVATLQTQEGETLDTQSIRIGSVYEWWPEIKLVSDNRIPPGKSQLLPISPPQTEEPLQLKIEAHKYRMHQEAFDYHELEGKYVRGRLFHRSLWRINPDKSFHLEELIDDHNPE